MSRSIQIYEYTSSSLVDVANGNLDSIVRNRGLPLDKWFELILLNGCPNRFKKILEDECMAELKDVLKEQSESMDSLTKTWSDSFKNLKNTVDDRRNFVKKAGGDIKDSVEKLRQSLDKFISIINEEKLSKITDNISVITKCLCKIEEIEKTGLLQKFALLINSK